MLQVASEGVLRRFKSSGKPGVSDGVLPVAI
jgi:hypothetical protein